MTQPPNPHAHLADGFPEDKSVFVTNISLSVQEAHLKQLFSYCGTVERLKFLSHTLASPFKACLIEFDSGDACAAARELTGTDLLGLALIVRPSAHVAPVPDVAGAVAGQPPTVQVLPPPPEQIAAQARAAAAHAALALAPRAGAPTVVLPGQAGHVPVPKITLENRAPEPFINRREANSQQSQEEHMRTVYVGNVPPELTNLQLQEIFATCGPVTFARISGGAASGPSMPTRYAFVQYATFEAAAAAVHRLQNAPCGPFQLRISFSKNAITRPPPAGIASVPRSVERDVMRELDKLNERLKKEAEQTGASDDPAKKRKLEW